MARRKLVRQTPEQALTWLSRAEWFGARRIDTALLRCQASRRLGDPDVIRVAIAELAARSENSLLTQREQILFQAQSGELAEAGPYLGTLLTDTSGDNKDVCVSYVIGFLRTERYNEAETLIQALQKDSPDDPFPWYVQGRIHHFRQSSQDAERSYREAIARCPGWHEPVLWLGELLADSHRQREAIGVLEPLMTSNAYAGRAASVLADCFKSIAEPAKARESLEAGLKKSPNEATLWISLGQLHQEEGRYLEGVTALEKAIQLRPWADDAWFHLAQCYQNLGDGSKADAAFAQVEKFREALGELATLETRLVQNPNDEMVRLRVAEILLQYRDPVDGIIVLQGVLDRNAECAAAHRMLADYLAKKPELSESERRQLTFHQTRAKDPEGSSEP